MWRYVDVSGRMWTYVDVCGRMLKPINPQELLLAVKRATKQIKEQDQLKELLSERHTLHSEENIILKTNRAQHVVKTSQIIRLQAEGAYTNFVTNKESIFVSKNLKYYEEKLNPHQFLRIHHSHLININAIHKVDKDFVVMSNKGEIPFSLRKKAKLLRIIS